MNRMFQWAIENKVAEGIFNATSPNPVTNAEFMRELRRALHRPWSPPTPSWAVHLGSWLMGTEACLALTGRRCVPKRLLECGFEFQFPDLKATLEDLFGKSSDSSGKISRKNQDVPCSSPSKTD